MQKKNFNDLEQHSTPYSSYTENKSTHASNDTDYEHWHIKDLEKELKSMGVDFSDCFEKSELINKLKQAKKNK